MAMTMMCPNLANAAWVIHWSGKVTTVNAMWIELSQSEVHGGWTELVHLSVATYNYNAKMGSNWRLNIEIRALQIQLNWYHVEKLAEPDGTMNGPGITICGA
ncbi:uncharacterized protein BJ212DRAFT_1304325 [Suillus subaureus]|uniref:Uncharacterized protein n=1 Tax=Suillus subaureus TaxID=48587 RepID=A0A9P7J616_9AGAM|nr:uncharacterized protein BJ212DRAFT_1304325 [Suillus subaureus]KAG1804305.1 hypothetical protein BJ212DRAFT_1304325 [Suillus subaureus]